MAGHMTPPNPFGHKGRIASRGGPGSRKVRLSFKVPTSANCRAIAPGLFLAAFLSLPAMADTCHFGTPGTTISIAPHPDAAAEVTIINRLAFRDRREPCVVSLDGLDVSVTYDAGPGRKPDVFITEPPEGYYAAPDWLLLDDGTSATVLIWPMRDMLGM
jgi:hypothetical protein